MSSDDNLISMLLIKYSLCSDITVNMSCSEEDKQAVHLYSTSFEADLQAVYEVTVVYTFSILYNIRCVSNCKEHLFHLFFTVLQTCRLIIIPQCYTIKMFNNCTSSCNDIFIEKCTTMYCTQWRNNRACKACSARGPSAVGGPKFARRCF